MKAILAALAASVLAVGAPAAQSDLDAFMERVLARRDDNWTKLQQYILDEREAFDLRGPDRGLIWGERRDYTWFLRDGRFVRSPLRVNGVAIADDERRKYEADFTRREEERERRRAERPGGTLADDPEQPGFVTSAYFLRFRFETGRYALVGRDPHEGRDALRIEYYPTRLFDDRDRSKREAERRKAEQDEPLRQELQRVMNKASLVTLWIDPSTHQILKFTFDNVGSGLSALSLRINALPFGWLAQVEEMQASMTMGEAFPEVWLPRSLEARFAIALAVGRFDLRYALDYFDYRRADVTSSFRVSEPR